jgi:hypothetical protein
MEDSSPSYPDNRYLCRMSNRDTQVAWQGHIDLEPTSLIMLEGSLETRDAWSAGASVAAN